MTHVSSFADVTLSCKEGVREAIYIDYRVVAGGQVAHLGAAGGGTRALPDLLSEAELISQQRLTSAASDGSNAISDA